MNALVLQCGGPTAVVNVTLAAIVRTWRTAAVTGELHGGRYGLDALLTGEWMSLSAAADAWLAQLDASSGMALGGGRTRLDDGQLDRAVTLLQSRRVEALLLIGGNGTMAAGRALAAAATRLDTPLRIVGVPKTIDNDIPLTDVCPGFPSAATFLINAVADVAADVSSMRGYEDVVLIEAMGRHTGWLAAATLLAQTRPYDAPHLVLVPEQPVTDATFLDAVRAQHEHAGICVVTVAEGVRDPSGSFLAERTAERGVERDASGQVILGRSGGPLPYLATLVRERLRLRCRLVRPDVLQRSSQAHVSGVDRKLAALVGTAAVDQAVSTTSSEPVMIAVRKTADAWRAVSVPLDEVQGERMLPPGAIDAAHLRDLLSAVLE